MPKRKRNLPPESKTIEGETWRRPSSRLKSYGFKNRSRASWWCGYYREQGYACKIIPVGAYNVVYRRKK